MTTNCIQKPARQLQGPHLHQRAGGLAGRDAHRPNRDFTPVIEAALAAPGFADDEPAKTITRRLRPQRRAGRGRQGDRRRQGGRDPALLPRRRLRRRQAGPQLLHRVRPEGAARLRDPHAGLRQVPLQQAGLRRRSAAFRGCLDIGQCNDAYSAIQIAVALAEAFNCGVNDLPLSMVLSWYEQKAVAILLTLLHLGIKNIRLGPEPAGVRHAARCCRCWSRSSTSPRSPRRRRTWRRFWAKRRRTGFHAVFGDGGPFRAEKVTPWQNVARKGAPSPSIVPSLPSPNVARLTRRNRWNRIGLTHSPGRAAAERLLQSSSPAAAARPLPPLRLEKLSKVLPRLQGEVNLRKACSRAEVSQGYGRSGAGCRGGTCLEGHALTIRR